MSALRMNLAARLARAARPMRSLASVRQFSGAAVAREAQLASLHRFTEEEEMLKEAVQKFAREAVKPRVFEMDEH
ncbi:hypothetical protein HKX48_002883 [Thoreauomyces humboldtii]|nr:hypothetical protein HKX48_002883 [Thoreauomyces humboldtii]